jgi:hypothetical protein
MQRFMKANGSKNPPTINFSIEQRTVDSFTPRSLYPRGNKFCIDEKGCWDSPSDRQDVLEKRSSFAAAGSQISDH